MVLEIRIITPHRIIWNGQVDEIILPTNTGQMGILPNHAPLITALDIGFIFIKSKSEWIPLILMGGFALIRQNQIILLVHKAEFIKTLEYEQPKFTFQKTKNKLKEFKVEKHNIEVAFIFKRTYTRYNKAVKSKY